MTTLAELTVELDVDADGLSGGLDRAEKKFNSTLNKMERAASNIRMKPTAIVGGIGAGLALLPAAAGIAAAGMGVAFAGGIAGLGLAAAAQSEEVKKHFSGLKDHVVTEFKAMSAPLEDTLIGFAGNARGIFDSLSPNIGAMFDDIAPKLTELGNTLESAFSGWGPVIDGASKVFGEFLDGLNDPEFKAALDELSVALTNLFGNTDGANLSNLITGVVEFTTKLINLLGWLQQNETAMKTLGIAIGAVAAALMLAKVTMVLYNATMLLIRAGTLIWTGIQWALNAALLANPITWIVLGILLLIAAIVLLIMHWDKVKEAVGVAWDWIKSKLAAVWNWIKTKFTELKTFLTNKMTEIWTWIKDKVTAIKDSIVNGFTTAKDKAVEIFQKIKDKVKEKIDDVVAFVKSLPQKVKDVFSGAGSWLWDAGKNIINGLLNGLKSMWNTVKGWFSNLTSIIPDWKGPMRVDMKLLEPSGEALMHGLNVGVGNGWSSVKSTLNGVTDDIGSTVQSSADRSSRRTSGAATTNVVIDFRGLSRSKLAEAIREGVRIEGGGNVQRAFGGN